MNKEQYRLPDGNYTTNAKRSSREWKDIYQPICDEFDLGIIGFDPSILFKKDNVSFDLPVSFCVHLRDLILAKDEYKKNTEAFQNKIQTLKNMIDETIE